MFAEDANAPLHEVAKLAGLGQATLYRNFRDRSALAAAILAESLLHTEAVAAELSGDPDAFFTLLRSVIERMADYYSLGQLARSDVGVGSELERQRTRLADVIKEPLRQAKAAGSIRPDLTIDDVFLVLAMVRGAMEGADGPAARATAGSRALALAINGLVGAAS